ncbi:MAG TPA: serine/threonine-protein kinase [Patescibacteria group bacterium]|nr:serine/threonine-protein kinase [Patescibacteria group bacterium]
MNTIGRYEIESLIGKGAMGVVFLARDPHLGRRVALKTYELPGGISEEMAQEFQTRLLREAHAAAALSHPHIVTVHDAGVDPGRGFPYIVMEYVPGRSLKEILSGPRRMSLDLGLRIIDSLADALDAAHKTGIVHRDIKPANILVRESDGEVKIADFGVARLSASELTRTGTLIGSPAYMSPEQVRGGEIDGRSDLFSLAVVFYEALTARRPFAGDDLPAVMYSVAHVVPEAPSRLVRSLPPAIDAFFQRALAKDPADRFPDGESFRAALQPLRMARGARPAAPPREARSARRAAARARTAPDEADAGAPQGFVATASDAAEPVDPASGDESTGPAPETTDTGSAEGEVAAEVVAASRSLGWLGRTWLLLIGLLFLFTLVGVPYLFATRGAELRLEGRSSLGEGTLTVRVDGRTLYERPLAQAADEGGLARLMGHGEEEFGAALRVTPGKHELTAEVATVGESILTDSIVVNLQPGENRILKVTAGHALGRTIQIQID